MVLYEIFTVGKLKGPRHAFTRIGFQNQLNTRNQGPVFRRLRLYLGIERFLVVCCNAEWQGWKWIETCFNDIRAKTFFGKYSLMELFDIFFITL